MTTRAHRGKMLSGYRRTRRVLLWSQKEHHRKENQMKPLLLSLTTPVLAAVLLLALAEPAGAAYYRPVPVRVGYRPITRQTHMPGWDWWRIYPWSPYNYGRNPYNPVRIPYVAPYPVYTPYPVYNPYPVYTPPMTTSPAMPTVPASTGIEVSGPLSTPPPHTAIIQLRVPSTWAKVTINGQNIDSVGTSRTFVTPELSGQRSYTVAATWTQHGRSTTIHQTVRAEPGHIVKLDFTHPGH
jgi:uncharacterized protein (TIGR03000 family)